MTDFIVAQPHFIYVLEVPTGEVKIGIAQDVSARVAALQTGNHQKIDIAYQRRVQSLSIAAQIEALLHAHYSDCRLEGEWFALDIAEAKQSVALAAAAFEAGLIFQSPDARNTAVVRADYPSRVDVLCACGCGARFTPKNPMQHYVNKNHRYARFARDKKDATCTLVSEVLKHFGRENAEEQARLAIGHSYNAIVTLLEGLEGAYSTADKCWVNVMNTERETRLMQYLIEANFA